jgi:hypothetical protein
VFSLFNLLVVVGSFFSPPSLSAWQPNQQLLFSTIQGTFPDDWPDKKNICKHLQTEGILRV